MNICTVILILGLLFCFTLIIFSFYYVYQYRKWYNRGYNEVKEDILKWHKGERKNKPFVEKPYNIKKSQFKENDWYHRGAYAAYLEGQNKGLI